ncbi:serine palmitoyltransferase component [Phlyctochytrium planicorne]|nr:serine palmitoyltransferase component [Phlyctochytrium planicorne]
MATLLKNVVDSPIANEVLQQVIVALNTTITTVSEVYSSIPGSQIVSSYIKDSYQNDPFRTALEAALVVFMIWYIFMKKNKPDSKDIVKLTEKEIQELCDDWEPEPLVPELTEFQKAELAKLPIIQGPAGPKVKLADGKERINLASFNFIGAMNRDTIKDKAVDALRKYGVGSCGPPGFYGTIDRKSDMNLKDVHMELEAALAKHVGTEASIIYSQGFSTISSVIPAFAKRGDILVIDDGCNLAILKGAALSRSSIKYFKHNDLKDLESVLDRIQLDSVRKKSPLTRRFIITEGLSESQGDIVDLPKLIEIKKKYKYRLILDESMAFGVLGKTGAGTAEHFGIKASEVDILSASMANSLASSGGFCAGNKEITEHQRLSGLAYTFSASLPAILAVSALEALKDLESNPEVLNRLRDNVDVIRRTISGAGLTGIVFSGDAASPYFHIRLRNRLETRDDEEKILQEVVDQCIKDGVLVTRAKYVIGQEPFLPDPSIRVCASSAHNKKESEKAGAVIRDALKKVLKAYKL